VTLLGISLGSMLVSILLLAIVWSRYDFKITPG